ncbi:MAG TPA: O-antigen ligase family protein [Thermoleophilaceae bacterium]|nr:O-antigen ligase family protein [Thermoleophilaceae bacterium]
MTTETNHPARPSLWTSVAAFSIPAILLLYYGLRGGSYDIVPRQEEALVVWWVLGISFALGLLPRVRPRRGVLVPLGAIALLAIWTAISLGFTQSDERTFAEVARFLHYLGLLLLVWSLVDARTWRAAAAGLLAGAVVICALALASRLWPGAFPTDYVRRVFQINRLSYPFNYWNAVGAFAVMSMTMSLAWSAHARNLAVRAVTLACVPMCGATAYLTYSRAAVIGTVLSVLLVLILSRNRWVALVHALAGAAGATIAIAVIRSHHQIADATGNAGAGVVLAAVLAGAALAAAAASVTWFLRGDQRWRLPVRPARAGVVAIVVLAAVLIPTAGHAEITKGWHQFKKLPPSETSSDPAARLANLNGNRYFIWRSALHAFDHHPIKGTGAGTFGFWWSSTGGGEFLRDAHSLYLEELGEQGIFGGVLIVVFVLGLGVVALRARRLLPAEDIGPNAALVAAFGVYLFHAGVDWMWESTTVTVLALLAVACAAAAASRPATRSPRLPVRAGVVAVSAVAFLVQIPGLASTLSTRDSQSAFDRGDMPTALAKATQAIGEEPWAASPYSQRALVEEAQGRLAAARVDMLRAEKREPTNYEHPLLLSRIDAERGDANAALADLRRAKQLRPRSPFVGPEK